MSVRGKSKMNLPTMLSGNEESFRVGDAGTHLPIPEGAIARGPEETAACTCTHPAGVLTGCNAPHHQYDTLEGPTVAGVVTTVLKEEANEMSWITGTRPGGRSGQYVITRAGLALHHEFLKIPRLSLEYGPQSATVAVWPAP